MTRLVDTSMCVKTDKSQCQPDNNSSGTPNTAATTQRILLQSTRVKCSSHRGKPSYRRLFRTVHVAGYNCMYCCCHPQIVPIFDLCRHVQAYLCTAVYPHGPVYLLVQRVHAYARLLSEEGEERFHVELQLLHRALHLGASIVWHRRIPYNTTWLCSLGAMCAGAPRSCTAVQVLLLSRSGAVFYIKYVRGWHRGPRMRGKIEHNEKLRWSYPHRYLYDTHHAQYTPPSIPSKVRKRTPVSTLSCKSTLNRWNRLVSGRVNHSSASSRATCRKKAWGTRKRRLKSVRSIESWPAKFGA